MKNKKIIIFVLVVLNIIFSGTALAETVTVDDSGGCDYTSIQDAIDNSIEYYEDRNGVISKSYPSDLTIIVYPSVYNESVKISYPLELIAYSSNPADTVIESEGYAIDFSNYDHSMNGEYLIDGFTIRGAEAGIYCHASDPYSIVISIENNIITGGGVSLGTSIPTIINNKFYNGSGISVDNCGPVKIIDNDFINSTGIYASSSSVNIDNNYFTENGRVMGFFATSPQITNNIIRDNKAGICLDSGGIIVSNVITGNEDYGVYYSGFSDGSQLYNNYFNNEVNLIFQGPSIRSLSIESAEGQNIVGGSKIGGNFWGKPDGTGFSQTCPDADLDGFCDEPYIINSYIFYPDLVEGEVIDYLPLKGESGSLPNSQIPEFPSIAVPVVSIMGLVAMMGCKKE